MLVERGDLVDRATDVVEQMLDDVVAVEPTDDKGRRSCPAGRPTTARTSRTAADFADVLRAGENDPFTETAVDGIPISEKLERFAGDNEMPVLRPAPRPHDADLLRSAPAPCDPHNDDSDDRH